MTDDPRAPRLAADLRRGRGRPAVPLARDQARALPRPDPGLHRAARRPAARLPVDPPDRHQRQDQHQPDDRHAAARARPAHRALHLPAPRADERADQHRRRAADRRGVRPRLQRRRALHPPRRRRAGPPAELLRDDRRDGVRRVRRRPGRRRRRRGRHGRRWDATNVADAAVAVVLPIAVDHAKYLGDDAGRPSRPRRPGSSSPAPSPCSPSRRPRSPTVLLERAAEVGATAAREGLEFGVVSRTPAVGGQVLSLQGLRGALRRRVPAALRRPPGAERRRRAGRGRGVPRQRAARRRAGARGVRRGHLARPPRDHPAQPDDRARRRAQPARRRGRGRGAGGLLLVHPADRGDGRDGGQGPRGPARRPRAAPRARRLHPELHRARDVGRAAGRDRPRGLRRGPGQRRARLADAIDQAATLAEAGEAFGVSIGSGAVLVTGSVVTVGEARHLLRGRRERARSDTGRHRALAAARHVRRGPEPRGDHARPDHAR